MKKISITIFILATYCIAAKAQAYKAWVNGPEYKKYDILVNEDITSVMKKLGIKDTAGKTERGFMPQFEPGVKLLFLKAPNGDSFAFKENKLRAIIPKHDK